MPKALVVEDEYLIAMNVQQMFEDIGWPEVYIASNVEEALEVNARHSFKVATLDSHLQGPDDAERLAAHFDARGTAIIVATGSDRGDLPAGLQLRPYLSKPFATEDLRRALLFFWPDSEGVPLP